MSTASSGQRVIVVAVDASENAKDAFDCTFRWCMQLPVLGLQAYTIV